jgi:type IV secretory pathway protease TraF
MRPATSALLTASLALPAGGLVAHATPRLALINESPSIPRGLYVRAFDQSPRPGAIVAVQPQPPARRYLGALGMPAGTPLLKRIAAVAGDNVCRNSGEMRWPRGDARALTHDRRGAALPAWSGCRQLGADELLVMGDTPTSFDSRYFGPVRRSDLEGVYVEALTW